MKITDLQVDGFGIWKGLTVDSLSREMTVFYGHNEAGKTTLMQFIRTMLFGFSEDRMGRYVPPIYGGLAGGSLSLQCPQGSYELQRHIESRHAADPVGDLAITSAKDGTTHGRTQLAVLTAGIDETIFNNVFAIGLREIQELGSLNNTDAAEHLYKLTSGLDRVSLVDVMRDTAAAREAVWSRDPAKSSVLAGLLAKRRDLEREIDELKSRARRWTKLSSQTVEINERLTKIDSLLAKLDKDCRLVEVCMQIGDRWQARSLLDQQIAELKNLPDERDVSLPLLDELNQRITRQRERVDQIRRQRRQLKKEAAGLVIDRNLWSAAGRVDALHEHLPWIEALQGQVDRLKADINAIQVDLSGEFDGLGAQLKLHKKQLRDLSESAMSQLRSAATDVMKQTEQKARAQEELDRAEYELEEITERYAAKTNLRGAQLTGSLDDTGQAVNRLRRRVELESKIEKLNQTRQDLELEIDDVVSDQVLPVGKLTIIGVIFVIGIVFLGFGVRLGWALGEQTGSLMMIMAAVFGLLSIGLKHHWESLAREELDDFRSQFELVRQQLKRAKAERDELDKLLPSTSGGWESQLKEAEIQLQRIEDLVPLENRIKLGQKDVEEAKRLLGKQSLDVDAATARWKTALRGLGLPDTLEPTQLKEVSQRSERIAGIHTRLEQLQLELNDRNKELSAITNRIDQVLGEIGITYQTTVPAERLQQLKSAIQQQRRLVAQRKELRTKYLALRTQGNRAERELDAAEGRKQRILSVVGASNDQEFRNLALQHDQLKKLSEKRKQISEQIAAALGNKFQVDEVDQLLTAHGANGLERRWETVNEETSQLKQEQSQLHQQRGKIAQEIKTLGEDHRLDEARLELNATMAQVGLQKRRWQSLALTSHVLETIRTNYEAQRQPETLREASYFLEKLTGGQYARIWTRLIGEELLVDNRNKETLRVELLSRGTREAVYLALRLALVSAYARRGAILPMVLDDVLVNFDAERARAAAKVLREFAASGYQILMFTCHDHFRDLFHDLDADVRILPHHKDVVRSNAVPTPFDGARRTLEFVPSDVAEIVEVEPEECGEYAKPHFDLEESVVEPELQFELSAVNSDEDREKRLRDHLVYISDDLQQMIDLSDNDPIWGYRPQQTA